MTNLRVKSKTRISPDVEKLIAESIALSASGSRLEDIFWEEKLFARLTRLLKNQNQTVIDSALDQTFKLNTVAFEILADAVETLSESITIEHQGEMWDVLFVVFPVIAQTRYTIPSGPLPQEVVTEVAAAFHRFVMSADAHLSILPWMYSIDQMPQSHSQTRQLLEKMATAAVTGVELNLELKDMPETIPVLADPRFMMAAIAVKKGGPLFRWQEDDSRCLERSQALKEWQAAITPSLIQILPGCEFDLMLPDAYFTNCREADKRVRPLSLKAAINYLCSVLTVDPAGLSCVIGAFGQEVADEFRVSFGLHGSSEIIYGVVWPLFDRESVTMDELGDSPVEGSTLWVISDTLKAAGIQDIFRHAMLFEPEMCEDCGVPLFPDRSGEVVHAEMPEDTPNQHPLFH
jgi:hypothetical protein